MPKPSKQELSRREVRAAEYKWEILRRNKDYIEGMKRILELEDKMDFKNKDTIDEWLDFSNNFKKKWRIASYPVPEKEFKDMLEKERWDLFNPALNMEHKLLKHLVEGKYFPGIQWKDNHFFPIEIDLDAPKDKIMYEVGSLVDTLQGSIKRKEQLKRPRTKDFKKLLKIYDLRETRTRDGKLMSFGMVAKKMYPNREITKTLADSLRKSYNMAKKLIDNAHQDIW